MSATSAILTRSWPVGDRVATLSAPRPRPGKPLHVCIEWTPSPPLALSGDEWKQYRIGRDAAMKELAQCLGGAVAVLDV